MAKILLAFLALAALAVSALGATIPADNKVAKANDVPCIACELLAGFVEIELSQGNSQETVVQSIKELCAKLPSRFQITCRDHVQHDMTKFVAAVALYKGNLKQACKSIDQCEKTELLNELTKHPFECLNCKLLANLVYNLIQHGKTTDQIENDALQFCSKLLPPMKDSCTNLVTNDLATFLKDVTDANGNAEHACVAFGKCTSETTLEGGLPVKCGVCLIEGIFLAAALKAKQTKANLDMMMLDVCTQFPAPLNNLCANKVSTDIDPLIDALNGNGEDAQKACVSVNKCHSEMTTVTELKSNPLQCVACKAEGNLLADELKAGKTNVEIHNAMGTVCTVLLPPFNRLCFMELYRDVDPLVDALVANGEDVQKACVSVNKC